MMIRYYAKYENNRLIAIGTGSGGTEITEEEYNELLIMIREKAELVNNLYSESITLAEVPEEWQEEIQRRVDERIAMQEDLEEMELSADEALDIILGGEVE